MRESGVPARKVQVSGGTPEGSGSCPALARRRRPQWILWRIRRRISPARLAPRRKHGIRSEARDSGIGHIPRVSLGILPVRRRARLMAIFEYQWCSGAEPSPDRVSQHTMARITITVGGRNVTSVYDRYLREYRDHIFVPLAHVAEWLAANWWHLWYEPANVARDQRPGFSARHNLAHAGDGFVLPWMTFVPIGNQIRVAAKGWSPRHAPLEFRSACDEMLPRDDLEQEFRALVDEVIAQLRATRTPFEPLESEWSAIESLDSDAREFCQAAALMGLDPFDLDVRTADRIAHVWNHTHPSIREETLGSAYEDSLEAIQTCLAHWLESAEQAQSGDDWHAVRQAVRGRVVDGDPPWRSGHDDARAVRQELTAAPGRFDFGEDGTRTIWSQDVEESPSPRVQGCVASDSPSCIVVRKAEPGKRFLLARALGDYIGREHPGPAILGTLETARQARSRAFAAEFLAPAEWLRSQVGIAQSIDGRVVRELATELGVSEMVVEHQVENHHIAAVCEPFGEFDW